MNLKVHLMFPGTCEEALLFYKNILKGTVDFIFRKKDEKSNHVDEVDKDKISHMVIKTPHFELAGEDVNHNANLVVGNNNKLVLAFTHLADCQKVFEALSEDGFVSMPFQKTFFCEGMGEVTDKFGISWIVMMTDENYSA